MVRPILDGCMSNSFGSKKWHAAKDSVAGSCRRRSKRRWPGDAVGLIWMLPEGRLWSSFGIVDTLCAESCRISHQDSQDIGSRSRWSKSIRSRVGGDKRTERPRPRRWSSLAYPVESHSAGRIGTEPEGNRPVRGSISCTNFPSRRRQDSVGGTLSPSPKLWRGFSLKSVPEFVT